MTELQEKHNYLYNSLDDSSNLAGFTADYLEIDGLAHEIIKCCQQEMKYNERK